jgi:predicted transcriptional regulator
MDSTLEKIFGNRSARQILLHIFHYGEIHASGIAQDCNVAVTPILHQLNRLEDAGILISKEIGRARVYSFNSRSPYAKLVVEMVRLEYDSIPLSEKQIIFKTRRRPRRKGKPVNATS